ncbi:MAG: hypothetical protein NVS1B14_11070 [Vulcanimicrobiaceae bacterium]
MNALFPFVIGLGVFGLAAMVAYTVVGPLNARGVTFVKRFSSVLDVAGIGLKPEELVLIVSGSGITLWVLTAILMHPSFVLGALLLPVDIAIAAGLFYFYVGFRKGRRNEAFLSQLEVAMRLMASGLRIGLSLRMALSMVIEELSDPIRHEFQRVIGQTNIGITPYDALDDLAQRMPSNETLMLAKVIRVQSQTGGNLSTILEHLSNTIKDRRRIARKINALTAEARAGALVLEALPVFVGGFVLLTQHDMASALLTTGLGHFVLLFVVILEALAIFSLSRMVKVNV